MPYRDLEKRKEYHKNYMRNHKQVLTPEQKLRKAETSKLWAMNNIDKLREYQRNRWFKDRDKILTNRKNRDMKNPEIRKNQSKKYWEKQEVKFRVYKRGADIRNLDFSLSSDEFNSLLFSPCHYCGSGNAMGIDRKSNEIGYFSYNVVACCKTCNFMKGTLSYQDFINQLMLIMENLSK